MAAARERFAPAVEPNVIPFIDVLLVLLIIFMVTAPKPTTDFQVDMPPPGISRASDIPPTTVVVHAGAGGAEYLVGAQRVTLDQLGGAALTAMLAADPRMTPADARLQWAHLRARRSRCRISRRGQCSRHAGARALPARGDRRAKRRRAGLKPGPIGLVLNDCQPLARGTLRRRDLVLRHLARSARDGIPWPLPNRATRPD